MIWCCAVAWRLLFGGLVLGSLLGFGCVVDLLCLFACGFVFDFVASDYYDLCISGGFRFCFGLVG